VRSPTWTMASRLGTLQGRNGPAWQHKPASFTHCWARQRQAPQLEGPSCQHKPRRAHGGGVSGISTGGGGGARVLQHKPSQVGLTAGALHRQRPRRGGAPAVSTIPGQGDCLGALQRQAPRRGGGPGFAAQAQGSRGTHVVRGSCNRPVGEGPLLAAQAQSRVRTAGRGTAAPQAGGARRQHSPVQLTHRGARSVNLLGRRPRRAAPAQAKGPPRCSAASSARGGGALLHHNLSRKGDATLCGASSILHMGRGPCWQQSPIQLTHRWALRLHRPVW